MTKASPTLLVNLESGQSNAGLLHVARNLADRLGAAIIGVAARQPMQLDLTATCYVSPELINDERAETDRAIAGAEAEFRGAFDNGGSGADLEWRSSVSFAAPSDFIVGQARHADLVLTSMPPHGSADTTRATVADLVMQCGRPVLVVPPAPATAALDRVMLAWKDTREARRAALDALPLLKRATHVTIVEIADGEDLAAARTRLTDVARWLAGHGIQADVLTERAGNDDAADLEALAVSAGANLLVAGAYGHSRIREWALGGVTSSLLRQGNRCVMLSH